MAGCQKNETNNSSDIGNATIKYAVATSLAKKSLAAVEMQQQPQDQKSFLMVEIRTFCGSGKRIQGNMTATQLRERIMEKEHIQVEESTLPVNDNEKCRAVKGYLWAARMPTKKFVTDQVTAMCPEMGSSGVYPELEAQKWSSSSGNSPWMQVCGLYPLLESKFPDIFTKFGFGNLSGRTSLDANLYE